MASGRPALGSPPADIVEVGMSTKREALASLADVGLVLGAMTSVTATTGQQYTAADLARAEDLVARTGLAFDNARLYRATIEQVTAEAAQASPSDTRG